MKWLTNWRTNGKLKLFFPQACLDLAWHSHCRAQACLDLAWHSHCRERGWGKRVYRKDSWLWNVYQIVWRACYKLTHWPSHFISMVRGLPKTPDERMTTVRYEASGGRNVIHLIAVPNADKSRLALHLWELSRTFGKPVLPAHLPVTPRVGGERNTRPELSGWEYVEYPDVILVYVVGYILE